MNCKPFSTTAESRVFRAQDSHSTLRDKIDDLCPAEREIALKVGAQVMICKNINMKEGLANGSRAVVVGFEPGVTGKESTIIQRVKILGFYQLNYTGPCVLLNNCDFNG